MEEDVLGNEIDLYSLKVRMVKESRPTYLQVSSVAYGCKTNKSE